ncbi:ABC transporter ATP-binding protein [Citricoccus sp. I39-566]|uniref:ABC transporter ATP-binding protein n=1 Tax=Citricoccus sp. I39-566 TaxID=3073268 RepID=UPI00286B0CFC|nr:ABC transporter ATP-binding protein [Citricoccus sp. I39-566]WMY77938.1 ABC transporter ATP-binding protein [Citricoccus sp. I39-566]
MRLRSLTAAQGPLLSAGILLSLVGTFAMLVQPLLVAALISTLVAGESAAAEVIALVVLFSADVLCGAVGSYLVARAGENIVLDLRTAVMSRILRARIPAVSTWDRGDLFTRASADTSLARVALSSSVSQLATSVLSVAGCLVMMFVLDAWLGLLTVATIGVTSLACVGLVRAIRTSAVENREHNSDFGSVILSQLSNLETVKALRAEDAELGRATAEASRARGSGLKVARIAALLTPAMNVGTQLSLALVIIVGAARAGQGLMALDALVAFVLYLLYLVSPLVVALMSVSQFQQGRAALDRVGELTGLESETTVAHGSGVPGRSGVPDRGSGAGELVRFSDVRLTYPGREEPALRGVDLVLPARGLSAIVGPSGAGKSTVFKVLERFYEPDAGSVLWRGADIRSMPLEELRGRMGFVSQDGSLMRGSVWDNITLGASDASRDAIWDVLREVGLEEAVRNLPLGLDQPLGDDGAGLSGGQRQRLALARVLIHQPDLLLLDEATAHLDSDSEARISSIIATLAESIQVVLIAHRLSSVVGADQIIVLEDGLVTGSGRHGELVQVHETYRRLVSQQFEQPVAGH